MLHTIAVAILAVAARNGALPVPTHYLKHALSLSPACVTVLFRPDWRTSRIMHNIAAKEPGSAIVALDRHGKVDRLNAVTTTCNRFLVIMSAPSSEDVLQLSAGMKSVKGRKQALALNREQEILTGLEENVEHLKMQTIVASNIRNGRQIAQIMFAPKKYFSHL